MRVASQVLAMLLVAMFVLTPSISAINLPKTVEEDLLPIIPKDYAAYIKAKQYTSIEQFYSEIGYWNQASDTVRALILYNAGELVYAPEGVSIKHVYKTLPMASVNVDRERFTELSQLAGIKKVYLDQKFETTSINLLNMASGKLKADATYPYIGKYPTLLNDTTKLIGAQDLWRRGIMGNGTIIAILDTGIDSTHPNMLFLPNSQQKKVIKEISMVDIFDEVGDVSDKSGHGSHTAGIASSSGAVGGTKILATSVGQEIINATILPNTQMGVAPMSKIYNVKVLSNQGFGLLSWIISGIEWASENGADVISMSLGAYPFFLEDDPLSMAVEKAVRNNVTVVTSAGNVGPTTFAVGTPGISRDAIAVAAAYGTRYPIYFSSRGPASYNLIQKPDILAPGMVVSNWAFYQLFEETFYLELAGTSMAAPHVAGAAAMLKQAFPAASPYAIKAALLKGATDIGLEPNVQGAGFLNVSKAYDILAASQGDFRQLAAPEAKVDPVRPISNLIGGLAGTRVRFIGTPELYSNFLNRLIMEGATISVQNFGPLTVESLADIDVLMLAEPSNLSNTLYNKTAIDLFVGSGKSLFFIGDTLRNGYDNITKQYGINWNTLAMGGSVTRFGNHPITQGLKQLWLGGSIASLKVGTGAQVIAQDFLYPVAALWTGIGGRSKVFVLADDDVLNDANIKKFDNLAFGLNIIAFLASERIANSPPVHEVGVGLRYPKFILNASTITFKVDVSNFGSFTERVSVSVNITNERGIVVQRLTDTITDLFPGSTRSATFTSSVIRTQNQFAEYRIVVQTGIGFREVSSQNNRLSATFDVIARNQQSGTNPRVAVFAPSKITSSLYPTMTYFPGDFKVLNVTLLSSYQLNNARVRIVGNVSQFTSFSNAKRLVETTIFFDFPDSTPLTFNYGKKYDAGKEIVLGSVMGYKGLPIQIIIDDNARPGRYTGAIELVEGNSVTLRLPIELSISNPKGVILYDDVFHGFDLLGTIIPDEVERLWGGSFRGAGPAQWYEKMAKSGFQLVSLKQYMNNTGIKDPWQVFTSGKFKNIILHDTEMHAGRIGMFTTLLRNGTNLEIHYDNDFRGASLGSVSIDKTTFFGLARNFNASNPIGRGIANATFLFGVELSAQPGAQIIATAYSPASPELSGIIAASFKVDGGGKLVAIGDSNLFENTADYYWLLYIAAFGINATTLGEFQLGVNAAAYLTNAPPAINNLATDRATYGAGSQVQLTFNSPTATTARITLKDPAGNALSTIQQGASANNRITLPLSDKLAPGSYSIDARVTDDMGDFSNRAISFAIRNTVAPTLQIVSPKADDKIIGMTRIEVLGEAKSPGTMDLFIDNDKAATWSIGARTYLWDTSKVAEGQHRIRVAAIDEDGNSNETTVSVQVARPPKAPPPNLQIISPIPNQKLMGAVKIEVLGEAKAPATMDLFIDDQKVQGWSDVGLRSYIWNSSLATEGIHKIRVVANDQDGNTREASIDVIAARPEVLPPPPLLTNTEIIIIVMNVITIASLAILIIKRRKK
ncbi:MAG: hypothetical protein FJ358_06255 [Thaumarchaeota archaeon]|nr:hypothetical protein [Nitrososphaerota archaeon]